MPSSTTWCALHIRSRSCLLRNLETTSAPNVKLTPSLNIFVRVRPQQVAQQPSIGHICRPHDPSDLFHALQVGAEPAMAAKDLLVNDGCDGETVETVSEGFPEFDIVTSLALIIEPIDPVDRSTFVVSS